VVAIQHTYYIKNVKHLKSVLPVSLLRSSERESCRIQNSVIIISFRRFFSTQFWVDIKLYL